jgi:hypothetical protein
MASLLSYDESQAYSYTDGSDDCRSIRRDCVTPEQWQSQLLRSLQDSGWTAGMLLYLPAPVPLHWILILQHECRFTLIAESLQDSVAWQLCRHDRRLWMALACRTLRQRGWTPTMLSSAWDIPKTNIYRFLEIELPLSDSDG